mgnify:CR=1 FL=1
MEQKTARIAAIKGVYDIEIQEYPIPELQPGCMLIKIEAAAVCGSDKHNLTTPPKATRTIGHEFCGRIVAMAEGAKEAIHCYNGEVEVGDRVAVYPHVTCGTCYYCTHYENGNMFCENDWMYGGSKADRTKLKNNCPDEWPHFKGGFADYVYLFPNSFVWKVPDDMPAKVAVLLDPCAVAMRAVEQAMTDVGGVNEGVSVSSRCLIVGDGTIGVLTGMILREMGVAWIGFTGHRNAKLQLAKELSQADAVINTKGMSEDEMKAAVREAVGGDPDIVFAAGNSAAATYESLQYVRNMGTLIALGGLNLPADPAHPLYNRLLFRKNAHITAVATNMPSTYDRAWSLLLRWKRIPFERIMTHEFHTLEELLPSAKHMGDDDYLKAVYLPEA